MKNFKTILGSAAAICAMLISSYNVNATTLASSADAALTTGHQLSSVQYADLVAAKKKFVTLKEISIFKAD